MFMDIYDPNMLDEIWYESDAPKKPDSLKEIFGIKVSRDEKGLVSHLLNIAYNPTSNEILLLKRLCLTEDENFNLSANVPYWKRETVYKKLNGLFMAQITDVSGKLEILIDKLTSASKVEEIRMGEGELDDSSRPPYRQP